MLGVAVSITPLGEDSTLTRNELLAAREADASRLRREWAGCVNAAEGTCESVTAGEKPDMRLGDTCVLCCQRECERCGESIDIDEELRVVCHDGYVDVCAGCFKGADVLYDDERNE